jgi:hypothetical protein
MDGYSSFLSSLPKYRMPTIAANNPSIVKIMLTKPCGPLMIRNNSYRSATRETVSPNFANLGNVMGSPPFVN